MANCEHHVKPPLPQVEYYVLTMTSEEASYILRRIHTSPASHEPSNKMVALAIHRALIGAGVRP